MSSPSFPLNGATCTAMVETVGEPHLWSYVFLLSNMTTLIVYSSDSSTYIVGKKYRLQLTPISED